MAQKKITDLQLISAVSDTLNIPGDDGIQTYRATALQFKEYILPDGSINIAKISSEIIDRLVPVGTILKMPFSQVPDGFLKGNGAAVSRVTYASLYAKLVTDQGFTPQTFTVTIATPGVVTKTGHGFLGGERLRLSTTGALPTGLNTVTDYFVWYIDANTFRLQEMSHVLAGTFINTSGTQSGTHSFTRSLWGLGDGSSTFNIPDLRGAFDRAWDDGRGLDPSRVIASFQMDAFQGHRHDWNGSIFSNHNDYTGTSTIRSGSGGNVAPTNKPQIGSPSYADGSNGTPRYGTETRPMSYALMPVIKY